MSLIFACAGLIEIIKTFMAEKPEEPDLQASIDETLRLIEQELENIAR